MGLNNCVVQGDLFGCIAMYKVTVTHGQEEPIHHSRERLEQAATVFVNECKDAAGYIATTSIRPVPPVNIQLITPEGQVLKNVTMNNSTKQF